MSDREIPHNNHYAVKSALPAETEHHSNVSAEAGSGAGNEAFASDIYNFCVDAQKEVDSAAETAKRTQRQQEHSSTAGRGVHMRGRHLNAVSIAAAAAVICMLISFIAGIGLLLPDRDLSDTSGREYFVPDLSMSEASQTEEIIYDISTADDGYIVAEPAADECACELIKGGSRYVYLDLPEARNVIPLGMGSGTYRLILARRVDDNLYKVMVDTEINAAIGEDTHPFTMPNYIVNFSDNSSYADLASELSDADARETVRNICSWVYTNIRYDKALSRIIMAGHKGFNDNIPDTDEIYDERKGVCIDKAALAAAMIRLRGIPARLVTGVHDGVEHAWLNVWIDGQWILADPTEGIIDSEAEKYVPELYY